MQRELHANKCRSKRIDVWQQAVDTDIFNPKFRSKAMRERLSNGNPNDIILTYVGRLGAGTPLHNDIRRCLSKAMQKLSLSCGFHMEISGVFLILSFTDIYFQFLQKRICMPCVRFWRDCHQMFAWHLLETVHQKRI